MRIFWFRRDLRLHDNAGLFHALKDGEEVLPLFIFDTQILKRLQDDDDARITFILEELTRIKKKLEKNGSSLLIRTGKPEQVFDSLLREYKVSAVYCNHDYEPYARERDEHVRRVLTRAGAGFETFKDQVIFEKEEVMKVSDGPYTVFTPYKNKWRSLFKMEMTDSFPSESYTGNFQKTTAFPVVTLVSLGFRYSGISAPPRSIPTEIIRNYDKTRDFPAARGTTRLSPHLRFGTVSIRELFRSSFGLNETFVDELIWREFYMMILWHFPHVTDHAFKPKYDRITWRNNEEEFRAWCNGMTGFPIVDAGMRELNQSGYMHNRARMVTASFLTKQLLIDWRWGEAYFARKLLDYELASNNGGWQWAAGTGCDAAPYFRIFNPALQVKKFDPGLEYIRKWVPEYGSEHYVKAIVEEKPARERALKAYAAVLK